MPGDAVWLSLIGHSLSYTEFNKKEHGDLALYERFGGQIAAVHLKSVVVVLF